MSKQAKVDVIINGEQAKAALKEIQTQLAGVKAMRDKAMTDGDVKGFNQLNAEFKKLTTEATKLSRQTLDVNDVLKNLSSASVRELQGAFQQLNRELIAMKRNDPGYNEKKVQVQALKKELDSASGSIRNQGMTFSELKSKAIVWAAAIMAVGYAFKKLYDAYEEQRVADKRLLFAVNGNIDAFQQLNEQSSKLQQATGIDDSVISQIQMLGVQSGKSTADVKKITEAAIELSSITGEDLQGSFLQLNGTFAGKLGKSLPRLSADFKDLTKEQLANGAAIDMVLQKYGGTAAESATSLSKMTQAWGEFMESLGGGTTGPINWVIEKMTYLLKLYKIGADVLLSFGGNVRAWEAQQEGIQSTTESVNRFREAIEKSKPSVSELKKQRDELTEGLKKQEDALKNSNNLSGVAEQLEKNSINTIKSKIAVLNELINPQKKAPDPNADKALEDAYKQEQTIAIQARDAAIAIEMEGYKKELDTLHSAYADKREAILHELATNKKLTVAQKDELNATLISLDTKYVQDADKLAKERDLKQLQYDKQLIELKLADTREGSVEEYQLEKQLLDNSMQIEIASVTGTEAQKAALTKSIRAKYARQQADADEKYSLQFLDERLKKEITNLTDAEQKKEAALKQKRADGTISQKEFHKEWIALQNQFTKDSLQIAIGKAEREIEIIKKAGGDVTQAEQDLAALRFKYESVGTDTGDGSKDKTKYTAEQAGRDAIDAATTIANTEFQISRDKNQRILDDKLNSIAKERDAELSNKNLTEAQKDAINKKYDAQERAVKKAAWEKQHKADIAQAWVNLALMVGKAAINMWPVPAIPMMAAAAIEGGMQVAAVTAQKVPEFQFGGYTDKDTNDSKPTGIVHANEFIGSAQAVRNPSVKKIFDIIDYAQKSGTISQIDLPAVIASTTYKGRQSGGYASDTDSVTPGAGKVFNSVQPDKNNALARALDRVSNVLEKVEKDGVKGKWVYFDFEKIKAEKDNMESSTNM